MSIHIEIGKTYEKDRYKYRIGDIDGSVECSFATADEIIEQIKTEIREMDKED